MNLTLFEFFSALSAGWIVTGWQAYKDSPWENFLWRRYVRSYFVILLLIFTLKFFDLVPNNLGILILFLIGCERGIGDIYKGFFRPNLHPEFSELFKRLNLTFLNKYRWRILAGIFVLVSILSTVSIIFGSMIDLILEKTDYSIIGGALIGLLAGSLSATGGAIKDSQFEGFRPLKFIRSPIVGMFAGLFITIFEKNGLILAWSLIGSERVIVELYKTFYIRQVRGIFENIEPQFPFWMQNRKIFLFQYLLGVLTLLVMLLRS